MKLRETVRIDAAPEVVWTWIADPARAARWNPRVVEVRGADRWIGEGDTWHVRQDFRGRVFDFVARADVVEPPGRLEVALTGDRLGRGGRVRESWTLEPAGGGTRVRYEVDIRDPRIPRWARWLTVLLHRFGQPVGEGRLDALKRMVEGGGRGPG